MRKPDFSICENKDADQLRGNQVSVKLISAFVFATQIVQSIYFLNPKFQASSYLLWSHSRVCVGPGLKPRRPVFSQRGSNVLYILPDIIQISNLKLIVLRNHAAICIQVSNVCSFTRPTFQVSIYRTIGPLVFCTNTCKVCTFVASDLGRPHYENMPMQHTAIFHGSKSDNFHVKSFDYFHIFAQNIDRGYTLEPPQ